jgi:hypothetical protein
LSWMSLAFARCMHVFMGGPHGKSFMYGYSGRKKAALAYVLTYTSGCVTKHFNDFNVLFVGRLFSGVATSLLYSAFESWLVAEHKKVVLLHLILMNCVPKVAALVMPASLTLTKLPAAAELCRKESYSLLSRGQGVTFVPWCAEGL